MSDNKRIAKNTLFLYFRMIIIMGVTLYTSRVVLDKLGADDYGLYNVVGGVVGMLMFINGTLATGTSRFITFELGRNDISKLSRTFNTALYTHIGLAIALAIILETLGLWFVYHKLIIPFERMNAAVLTYHISIATMIVSLAQVPYTALIVAHEKMGIYAYVSIFEVLAKLGVVYLLTISKADKLIVYAVLMAIVQCATIFFYIFYCYKHFIESKLFFIYDKVIFRSLMGFSGWNVIAFLGETIKLQGYLVLINMFFQPFVVAAQTIGNQVAGAMMQFITNFRKAVDPQVIKLYAAGDYEESKRLTLSSTVFSFDLVLLLGLPSLFILQTIMDIWLVEVPTYAVIFTQYIIIQRILSVFDISLYTPMVAAAKLKSNAILAIFFGPGLFFFLYIIFEIGGDVMWLQYIGIIVMAIYSFIIKPVLLVREVEGYKYRDFLPCFFTCGKVAALSVSLIYCIYLIVGNETIPSSIILFVSSVLIVCSSSFLFLEKDMRFKITQILKMKFSYFYSQINKS